MGRWEIENFKEYCSLLVYYSNSKIGRKEKDELVRKMEALTINLRSIK